MRNEGRKAIMSPMICPNDAVEMHPAKVLSHYGQPIILDQCEKCGGIWFDESELFRAKRGEAEKIELLDAEALRTSSQIETSPLLCPRDRAKLYRFTDKHFPDTIILVRCPTCHGVWLNRGEFTRYQKLRQGFRSRKQMAQQIRNWKDASLT